MKLPLAGWARPTPDTPRLSNVKGGERRHIAVRKAQGYFKCVQSFKKRWHASDAMHAKMVRGGQTAPKGTEGFQTPNQHWPTSSREGPGALLAPRVLGHYPRRPAPHGAARCATQGPITCPTAIENSRKAARSRGHAAQQGKASADQRHAATGGRQTAGREKAWGRCPARQRRPATERAGPPWPAAGPAAVKGVSGPKGAAPGRAWSNKGVKN